MKKTLKTIEVVGVYSKIKDAKLTGMKGADKFAVIRIGKAMKGIAVDFEGFVTDAREKLKDEQFEAMQEKVQKWQGKVAETDEEKVEVTEINAYFEKFNKAVDECVRPEAEKENEMEYDALSEDAFEAFLEANNYTIAESLDLEGILCGE